MSDIEIRRGLPRGQEQAAARLYDAAFGRKMQAIIPDPAKRQALLADCFEHDLAFVALQDGAVVGLAGFHFEKRAFTSGGGLRALFRHLGVLGGLWSLVGFTFLLRLPKPGELLMDGIAVDARCRGKGAGTRLLRALIRFAADQGLKSVRLDVIDTNPRARALYEREGFLAGRTQSGGRFTRRLFGFESATEMHRPITAADRDLG